MPKVPKNSKKYLKLRDPIKTRSYTKRNNNETSDSDSEKENSPGDNDIHENEVSNKMGETNTETLLETASANKITELPSEKEEISKVKIITILALNSCPYDFIPLNTLNQIGFDVRIHHPCPDAVTLKKIIDESCQLWIISDDKKWLNDEHIKLIEGFFNSGKGLYILGDNEPYNIDANEIAERLFNGGMSGNWPGGDIVGIQNFALQAGLIENHELTNGLNGLFEGYTIATIDENNNLESVMYGSGDNLVIAAYNKNGKRALIDGGFTRYFQDFASDETCAFAINVAMWLTNK